MAESNQEAKNVISSWDGKTNFENTDAGLGVCLMAQEWISEMNSKLTPSYESSMQECEKIFSEMGRSYAEPWSKLSTITRGGRSYPIQGSVDTLRAVYGTPSAQTKSLDMSGGDGLFFIIAEQDEGKIIYGMHNYGSSRDPESVHYSDQTFLFSQEALRYIPENL
jgi:acyl-homoserine lactone acylase PvdQ